MHYLHTLIEKPSFRTKRFKVQIKIIQKAREYRRGGGGDLVIF